MPKSVSNGYLTAKQVDYLLTLDETSASPASFTGWRGDPRFAELELLVKKAKAGTGIAETIQKARDIVSKALHEGCGEGDKVQVDLAMKLLSKYPEVPAISVTFKGAKSMDYKEIPERKLRRILEEIENDKSRKQDVLPVEHVGRTKLGRVVRRENPTDEKMFKKELDRGVHE